MVVISVYLYGVEVIKKKSSGNFLGGSMEPPPLYTNGRSGYLMQLSVNTKYCPTRMIGWGTQIWFGWGVPLEPQYPYLSLRVILTEKGTHC